MNASNSSAEQGFSIFELLVTMFISALLLGNITTTLISSTSQHHDQKVKALVNEQAQLLSDTLVYEIRMLGAGMPLGQEDFDILDVTLGDAPLPILTGSDNSYLQIRLDEIGTIATVVTDYTPAFTSVNISVDDVSGFNVGDTVYLSNLSVGQKSGLKSTITSISANTIRIDNAYSATPSAVFAIGSKLHKVSDVTYDNSPSGITRQIGTATAVVLLPRSSFAITYLDDTGATLTPPLTTTQIRNSLTRIRIVVSVDSELALKHGTTYTSTVSQDIFLRNLHLARL